MVKTKRCATDENCECMVAAGTEGLGRLNCVKGHCVTRATMMRSGGKSKGSTPKAVFSEMRPNKKSASSGGSSSRYSATPQKLPLVAARSKSKSRSGSGSLYGTPRGGTPQGAFEKLPGSMSPARLSPAQRTLIVKWARNQSIGSPTSANNVYFASEKLVRGTFDNLYLMLKDRDAQTRCLTERNYAWLEKNTPTIISVLENVHKKMPAWNLNYRESGMPIAFKKLAKFIEEVPSLVKLLEKNRCYKIIGTLRYTVGNIQAHMTVYTRRY